MVDFTGGIIGISNLPLDEHRDRNVAALADRMFVQKFDPSPEQVEAVVFKIAMEDPAGVPAEEAVSADDDEDRDDDEDDIGDDPDNEPTVPCPSCRRDILEDSPRCPYCERYISEEDHAGPKKPLWIIATALICLGIAIWWVLSAF